MNPAASSGASTSGDDGPLYLSVIDLGGRTALCYFAVVLGALVADVVRDDRLTFRSWPSFAVQAAAAFLLATIVVGRMLAAWKKAGSRFVPVHIQAAALGIGAALGAGTLAGGFFPDALGYRRRAPEMFYRTVTALVPAAIAVYLALRSASSGQVVPHTAPAVPADPPLVGAARDAALRALDLLDRGEDALNAFEQRATSETGIASADAERLWAALDGSGYVGCLREMPPDHAVTNALREAAVAQTDAAYLMAFARGAHTVMGHTAETARGFTEEVAGRLGRPGADPETLARVARGIITQRRDAAAALLHATRFAPSGAPAGLPPA